MVASKKDKTNTSSTSSKGEKSTSSTTKSSSSNVKTTTKTSTTSKSTSEQSSSQTSGAQQSSVVISEVIDSSAGGSGNSAIDDTSLTTLQTHYVVSQPEQQPHKAKEHYIFGGTQIVEMGTTMGSDLISREKNQSSWNGKFIYEGTPKSTVLKSWETSHATITEPSTSTTTTTTTKTNEEIIKTGGIGGGSSGISTHDVSTESSKLVGDTLKKQSNVGKTATKSFGKDSTDAASATDLLLESERCIAKKAYVTTDKTDNIDTKATSSTSNIESQILANKSLFDDKSTKTTTKNTIKTETSDRYPVSTLPKPHPGKDSHQTSIDKTILKSDHASDRYSTEQYSSNFSKSSRTEKATTSDQVIEIVDGKERIVSDKFNESGSLQSKSSHEHFQSKSGTGTKPVIEYDHKSAEENISFQNDRRGKEPIFDRDYRDSHRNIKQSGDTAPVDILKGSHETTRFDDKTKKYITDVRHHENNRQLDHSSRITDSIQSNYDVGTSRLKIDDKTNKLTDQTQFNRSSIDRNDHTLNNFTSSTSNDFLSTKSDSFDTKSTTYTSKVFDNKTNTWKTIDETNAKQSTMNVDRRSPTRQTRPNTESTSSFIDKKIDKKSTLDKNTINDIKSSVNRNIINDTKTSSSDTKMSMTKTTDKKMTQHLYDEKTKTWREVDEKTIKSKRPSLIRYVSKDNDGKFTTIYKRKLFDKRSGTWKVVDEKIYRNNNFNEHIPEVIEDVTNVTTTTYTTKVFDNKTNTWRIVDEQTITDRNILVPKDIADEIARDKPDIANITTTTELTKVS